MSTSRALCRWFLSAFLAGALFATANAAEESRTWTDTKGRAVEAVFAGIEGDQVLLRTVDGAIHRVALSNLSDNDRKLVITLPAPVALIPINEEVSKAAAKIDEIIARQLVKQNLKPNALCNDETFVRRAYLDIAGRTPNYDETAKFLEDTSPTKRAKLIDQLLESDGYESHLFNYFADMLRISDANNNGLIRARPYIVWLREQIREDKPYDQTVAAMLTATGKAWGNGATGYLLRDSGMLLDNLANTFSIFLGTDVACAQCHDHPFSEWTQKQFYELAAFFGATVTQLRDQDFANGDPQDRIMAELRALAEKSGGDPKKVDEVAGLVGDIVTANRMEVRDIKENRLRLPMDYKYKDGKPGEPVKPKFIRWSNEDRYNDAYRQNRNKEEQLRHSFAAWLTHPTNPRFAITIANRMWQRAFGAGVAEPVRNVDDPRSASNPELLQHLGREILRMKFHIRDFMRVVYNTQAWQREAITDEVPMGAHCYFQGPLLRRLSAEQTWDSFMTLVLGNPDVYKNDDGGLMGRSIDIDLDRTTGQIMASKLAGFQAMDKMSADRMGGNLATTGEGAGKVVEYQGMKLMRAAELSQPAEDSHFLRAFGQSDRNLIDGSNATGSQPQVLMLMNGAAQEMITNPQSLIFRAIANEDLPKKQVERAYLSVLSRKPTDAEKKRAMEELNNSGDQEGTANLVWALLNSLEFIFIQ
jgi:hypothetical protein